jgi:hypothetical protein
LLHRRGRDLGKRNIADGTTSRIADELGMAGDVS